MPSQKLVSVTEAQRSLIVTVNNATNRHNARYVFRQRFNVYQCSTSENSKCSDPPPACDALLKEIERLLKKYNKGYKTEVECTVVGPTFNSYYHSKFKRFVISNPKSNEKEFFKILQKLNNQHEICLPRQLRKEKLLKSACTPQIPFIPKKVVKKLNRELSKNPITTEDNYNNVSTAIANFLKYLCVHFNNDECKIDNNDVSNVPVNEDLNKKFVDNKSTNIKDNKNLTNYEKDEENLNSDNNQLNLNENCFKNFCTRLISQKPNVRPPCICEKKNKKLRQKGTNTCVSKNFAITPFKTKVTNNYKSNKNKNKSTNTKAHDNNHNYNNLAPNSCEDCLLMQNPNKNNELNIYTNDKNLPKNMECYNWTNNNDLYKREEKSMPKRDVKKTDNKIDTQDVLPQEKPRRVLFPFKKKFKSKIDTCDEIMIDLFPPAKRNKVMFKAAEKNLNPANKTWPIDYNSVKVQTDKDNVNCTRGDKLLRKIKKSFILDRDYDYDNGIFKKVRPFWRIFEKKRPSKRNIFSVKISPTTSLSDLVNYKPDKCLFARNNKGIKFTIGRVAEVRSLRRLNPVTPVNINYIKNEISSITYEMNVFEESEIYSICCEESFICNLDLTIDNTSNEISFNNLELKRSHPHCITLVEPATSLSTIYNISNISLTSHRSEYLINTYDFTVFKWNSILSDIHMNYPSQLSMQILRSRQERETATNIWYYQEKVGYQTKYVGTMTPNTVRDATIINTKYYFELLNIQEYNYLIGSSGDLKTCPVEENHSQIKREKQTESKFCLYLLQSHGEAEESIVLKTLVPQSGHTCCIQDVFGGSQKSNCESFDIFSETVPKCSACTSCQMHSMEETNNNTKIKRKLIKPGTLKPMKCKKTITKDGSIHLTCDYNTNSNKKHNPMWSKLNEKISEKFENADESQTELFLGITSKEEETSENKENELTFSDFEKMSERQLRCIISQLSKVISPLDRDEKNNSDETVDLSSCLEKKTKRQGIKFFVQPNNVYSNKLLQFFKRKKTK